jgi:hypothetical protein
LRISNIQYLHFFIDEKEYVFSVSSILTIETTNNYIIVNLKKENDKSVTDLSTFFSGLITTEILIFVGYYNKSTYENEVLSSTTMFNSSEITPHALVLKFNKLEK